MDTVVTIHYQQRWWGQEKDLQDDKETKRWRKHGVRCSSWTFKFISQVKIP